MLCNSWISQGIIAPELLKDNSGGAPVIVIGI